MIDFDFNSVKNHTNDNISKISSFDSVCNQLEKFFEIFFIARHLSKFNFEKENNHIKVSTPYNYNLYINDNFKKYQDIIKDVFPYLKYVILDDSCKINLSLAILYDILKKLNYINYIKINSFVNNFNYYNYNNSIDFLNSITSKNKKLVVGESTMPVINKNINEIEKFPRINSKYVIINNSNIINYLISVGTKEYYFYDFYSDEIHIEFEFPCVNFIKSTKYSIYFSNGLKSLDQSIKNNNCKIILNLRSQEDIIFLKDIIGELNLNHNWIIK